MWKVRREPRRRPRKPERAGEVGERKARLEVGSKERKDCNFVRWVRRVETDILREVWRVGGEGCEAEV